MKLNKKLLMAALAGAIVVGGGVGSFAEDAANADIPKGPEAKGPIMFEQEEGYKAKTEKEVANELKAAKAAAIRHIDSLSHLSEKAKELAKKDIESSTAEKDIDGIVARADVMERKLAEKENPGKEEEKDVSDSWYDQSKHPFAYRTKAEAEEAAKKALKNELLNPNGINKSYKVSQKYDGNWEYVLSPNLPETPEKPGKNPGITIDEWLKLQKEKEKNPGITIDEWLKLQKEKEEKPAEPSTPSVPENHYFENDYANIGAGKGTKEDGKKEDSKENGKKEDSKEESKENGKKENSKQESKENGKKEQKPGKEEKPAKEGKENTDSPNKKKKEKAALPKAGSEAEILTLAAASLSSVAGAFISLKKRK